MAPNGQFKIELEQEKDGRWLGEVPTLAGVMAYGQTRAEALAAVQALALRVLADRLEHGEALPEELVNVSFVAACAAGLPPKPPAFSPPYFGSVGALKGKPVPIACFSEPIGLILFSHSMIGKNSAQRCWLV